MTGVSRSFKWVSRVFERGLKVCQGSCNGVSGSFKEVSRVFKKFQEYFKIISRKIEGYFQGDFSEF